MSDTIVIKRECQRCPATEEVPVTAEDLKAGKIGIPAPANKPPKYQVVVEGKVAVSYSYLCPGCENLMSKAIEDLGKRPKKKTSRRSSSDD